MTAPPARADHQLPNGKRSAATFCAAERRVIATHEDCKPRHLPQACLTTQFLESVLDNVPVCVAAKNIEDGRYIFANRAFERFSHFSRDRIVGKRADEIFRPETAASIEAADQAALNAPEGQFRSEFFVERG
jgi:PAS domain-containing protein